MNDLAESVPSHFKCLHHTDDSTLHLYFKATNLEANIQVFNDILDRLQMWWIQPNLATNIKKKHVSADLNFTNGYHKLQDFGMEIRLNDTQLVEVLFVKQLGT